MAKSTDYLRFSAYSIKDLITRKLAADTKFTDQVYEGSNLAILIDIVSYMYQCLIYNLNNAAAESMFSDTQIYENINRLVKFIGYNPKGAETATTELVLSNARNYAGKTVCQYSTIDTGLIDSLGKKIYYSTRENETVTDSDTFSVLFYNGIWKLYNTVFQGTEQPYQTLTLDGIRSDANSDQYVPSDMIDVYVKSGNEYVRWQQVDQGLFTDNDVANGSGIYTQNDTIYNVRLNENKTYELTFGNGFTGKMLPKDAEVYVFYLQSNGPDGKIDPNAIVNKKAVHSKELFGLTEIMYNGIFTSTNKISDDVVWTNYQQSSDSANEESVEEIRRNAPEWFKTGNRLVTTSDWTYFVKNRFRSSITDVCCQNNWEYMSTFYRWLFDIGVKQHNNPRHYIDKKKVVKHAQYSDASDTNNVYLWIKMKNDADIYTQIIDREVQDIKMMTQEPVYLKPLNVNFAICAEDIDSVLLNYFDDNKQTHEFDPNSTSYLEVTLDDNVLYSTVDIQLQVANKIRKFFEEDNMQLGQVVDFSKLTNDILQISSIKRLRTIHVAEDGKETIRNGLSFASWTSSFIDLGDDLDVSNTARSLEPFQFPSLYKAGSIISKIKVIKKSITIINTIQY